MSGAQLSRGGRGLLLCLISFAAGLVRFASGTSWSPAVPVCGSFSEGGCPVRFTGGSGCRSQTGVSGRVCHLTLGFVLCLLPLWACSADVLGGVRWFIAFCFPFFPVCAFVVMICVYCLVGRQLVSVFFCVCSGYLFTCVLVGLTVVASVGGLLRCWPFGPLGRLVGRYWVVLGQKVYMGDCRRGCASFCCFNHSLPSFRRGGPIPGGGYGSRSPPVTVI